MDKLLENARLYLKILCKASSPQIKDWKQDDLTNALKWPAYFQKVREIALVCFLDHVLALNSNHYHFNRSNSYDIHSTLTANSE